ncbi:hypothetical protein [Lysobacter brunescens]|uniref:Lipoprotein n=1 Tax=Lysobacter brunescens TaxID=262323 RepID=A0ABW2YBN9_9GAMM
MNTRTMRIAFAGFVLLAGSGCMSVYKLPANAPSTLIEVPRGVTSWICADTEPQSLPTKDGRARIPVGQRIVIGANFASSDGYMNYYCSASASLVPTQDHEYLQDFETEGNRCSSLIYRKAPEDTRIGLAFEPTLSPDNSACSYRKKR